MKNVLKVYDAELTIKGPVYIGNGRNIEKKEYVFSQKQNKILVMNQMKLTQLLKAKNLEKDYIDFMLSDSRDDLGTWLKKKSVEEDEYIKCIRYSMSCDSVDIDTHSKLMINEFVKDAYEMPYIPGSSIKGMLRTVLLTNDIMSNEDKYRKYKFPIENNKVISKLCLKRNIADIESDFYRTLKRPKTKDSDAVNDIMSGVIISDSEPLSLDDLSICQRIELHIDGGEKKLNVLRECIKPETKVKFKITIDSTVCKFSKADIEDAVAEFANMYFDVFLQKFKLNKPDKKTVWLGGGVGFISKTEIYPLFGEKEGITNTVNIFRKTKVPAQHKHNQDIRKGVSPHICKVTYYNKQRYQMGMAELELSEIEV